jgi:hypothetical protein
MAILFTLLVLAVSTEPDPYGRRGSRYLLGRVFT